jgi:hypothetical protein
MVGRASVARLLEIAAEQLLAEPRVLGVDHGYLDQLAANAQADSEAWTAFYSGQGPRPTTGRLP